VASTQGTKLDTGLDLHQISTLNEYVSPPSLFLYFLKRN
jgi:hypothetical protein